jgi:hypothetical protein
MCYSNYSLCTLIHKLPDDGTLNLRVFHVWLCNYCLLYAQTVLITQTNAACFPPYKFRFYGSDSAYISCINFTSLSLSSDTMILATLFDISKTDRG